MDVLCTDKTGTLTEGVVAPRRRLGRGRRGIAGGAGAAPRLNAALQTGLVNPLDEAILDARPPDLRPASRKLGEIPFDFVRKRLSVVVRARGRRRCSSPRARSSQRAVGLHAREADGAPLDDARRAPARRALRRVEPRTASACWRSPPARSPAQRASTGATTSAS